MADIPDFVVLTVAGLFFVVAVLVGVCLYYYFFKSRNNNGQGKRKTESFRNNCGIVNPFPFYTMGMTPVNCPVELSGEPFTLEVNDEMNLTSRCALGEQHHIKPAHKEPVCRSISYEKPALKPPCHLQVIQEADEEETEEVSNDFRA